MKKLALRPAFSEISISVGEVAESGKAAVSKTVEVLVLPPRVQIPLSPIRKKKN